MPSFEAENRGVAAVADFADVLGSLLQQAEMIKSTGSIEPALKRSDFEDIEGQVARPFADLESKSTDGMEGRKKVRQYAIIETAVRDVFGGLIVGACFRCIRKNEVLTLFQGQHGDRLPQFRPGVEPLRHTVYTFGQR
jgi:hypothetical protein